MTRPVSALVHQLRATARPSRTKIAAVPELDGEPLKPDWLSGRASKLWDTKVRRYQDRGQNVCGCESALAVLCALEAALIDEFWLQGKTPSMSAVNAHRLLSTEFFDTPSSQQVSLKNGLKKNPFAELKQQARGHDGI